MPDVTIVHTRMSDEILSKQVRDFQLSQSLLAHKGSQIRLN